MKKEHRILIPAILILLALGFGPQSAGANSILIPGDTPEEAGINRQILESTDEASVLPYLTNGLASVRKTACQRLGDIGSAYSLNGLQAIIANQDESYELRNAASFSLWKIRYKETADKEGLLLSLIDVYKELSINETITFDEDIPFTDVSGFWQAGVDNNYPVQSNVYKQIYSNIEGMCLRDDVVFNKGNVEVTFKYGTPPGAGPYENIKLYFGLDKDKNGYAALLEKSEEGSDCYLGLFIIEKGTLIWDDAHIIGGVSLRPGFDVTVPHIFKVNINDSSVSVYIDNNKYLDLIINGYKAGNIGLGAISTGAPAWFDDLKINGTYFTISYIDFNFPITPEIIGWAAELLGDMGSQRAMPSLETIINDERVTSSSRYLKEVSQEAVMKINFIANTPEEDLVTQGLINPDIGIRKWAVNKLIEQDPADLLDRLETLFKTAQENGDEDFALYLATVLDEQTEKNRYPALEIEYPSDQDKVKASSIRVVGYIYGEPFQEVIDLVPGANTYTKTIVDKKGNPVTKSITIYYYDEAPVLSPIGNKQVLVGQPIAFTLSATDADDEDLLYFVYPYPLKTGMNFNYETRTFTWTPTALDIGAHNLRFKVDDGYGLTAQEEIIINVIDRYNLVASFNPKGIWVRDDTGAWANIHGICPKSMIRADINGDGKKELIADFGAGRGIWAHSDDGTWSSIQGISSKLMVAGDINGDGKKELIMDFGPPYGIWVYDNGGWYNLHGMSPKSMITGDLDGDGKDELIIDFGAPYGIWVRYGDGTWANMHGMSPKSMVTADLDGDKKNELIIDFGLPYGIWVRNGGTGAWSSLHGMTARSMTAGDMDGNGRDELIIDFGQPYGIWVRYDDGVWSNIHGMSPDSMIIADINEDGKNELIAGFGKSAGIWVYSKNGKWENIFDLNPELMT